MRKRSTGPTGNVRVRPIGDTAPSTANRYQYVVAGRSPSASTTTVWSCSGPVSARPSATTSVSAGSAATTHDAWR